MPPDAPALTMARDPATDPRVGDVIIYDGEPVTVTAVTQDGIETREVIFAGRQVVHTRYTLEEWESVVANAERICGK